MLYDMRIFDEPILVKVLTLCPETLVAGGGGGGKTLNLKAFLIGVVKRKLTQSFKFNSSIEFKIFYEWFKYCHRAND